MSRGKSEVREFFDDWSGSYDRTLASAHWTAPDRVFDAARPYLKTDSRILDVGIGTGILSARFREAAAGVVITGLDISQRMLQECADKGVADSLRRCDVEHQQLPVPDHSSDLTVASGVFEFLGTLRHAFSEMVRVTRPGGIIAFSYTPNAGSTTQVYSDGGEIKIYSHSSHEIERVLSGLGVRKLTGSPRFTGLNNGHAYPNKVFLGRVAEGRTM